MAGQCIHFSTALVGELVGIEQLAEKYWSVEFGPMEVAWLDDQTTAGDLYNLLKT
ncbi:MAG: hypothetical protein JRI80_18715 [Deltaproteobacteria bacterium]|nr:hypothetical protein [Deltaproteobacteria bacterium]